MRGAGTLQQKITRCRNQYSKVEGDALRRTVCVSSHTRTRRLLVAADDLVVDGSGRFVRTRLGL
jgi:hypothetical protein